ncbi:unnamed protein product [Trichogramma brassicae]|uniref:Ig-like domain-containing protein n=1 Tax=Trichogramma brassicae TaxID=86971 RepID=A0A6H5I9F3_9HYME|nr:unnamed protein product [Trichogramma brassicae]
MKMQGSTIRLMCMTPNMQNVGIGFGWSKNRALLRLEPGQEVWEDLYPAGSLLTLSNARHTAVYSCNVAHRSASVRVDAVNSSLVPLCPAERLWNRDWPSAAPGSKAILSCPLGFVGRHATRLCSMRSSNLSEWDVPNFEACFYEPLVQPYNQFRSLTLGYESTNGSSTIQAIWDVLQYRRSPLYPGEGDRIISLLQEVEHYQYNIDELSDLKNSAEATLRILDKILNNAYSIVSKQLDRELSSSSASAVTQLPAGTTYLLAGVCEPVAVYPEARGVAVGIDARDYSGGEVGSTYTPHIGLPEIQIHRVDERYLENVSASGSNCASVRTNTDSYTLGGKQRCDVTAQTESQAFFGSLAMPPAPEPYATVLPEPTRKDMSGLPSLQQCNIMNSQHRHHQHHQHYQHQHHHHHQHHQHHQYPSVELHQLHQHQPRQAPSKLGSQGLQSIMKHHHLPSQTSQHQQMQQQMHIETCLAMPDVTLAINGPEVAELLSKKQPLFIVPAPDESLYIQQVPGTTDESSEVPEKMPDIANMNERKQPDGEAKVVLVKPEIVIEECVVVGSSDLHHIHQPNEQLIMNVPWSMSLAMTSLAPANFAAMAAAPQPEPTSRTLSAPELVVAFLALILANNCVPSSRSQDTCSA